MGVRGVFNKFPDIPKDYYLQAKLQLHFFKVFSTSIDAQLHALKPLLKASGPRQSREPLHQVRKRGYSCFRRVIADAAHHALHIRENKKVTGSQIRTVGWMTELLNSFFGQKNSPRLGICAPEHCRDAAESIARSSGPEFFDENADDWLLPAALSVNIHFCTTLR